MEKTIIGLELKYDANGHIKNFKLGELQWWLRENHKIRVLVDQTSSGKFTVNIFTYKEPNNVGNWERQNLLQSFAEYDDALQVGIEEGLKLI